MNLKNQLEMMNISDLRFICRELRISCPEKKSSIVNKLLEPLNNKYRMNTKSLMTCAMKPGNFIEHPIFAEGVKKMEINTDLFKDFKKKPSGFHNFLKDFVDFLRDFMDFRGVRKFARGAHFCAGCANLRGARKFPSGFPEFACLKDLIDFSKDFIDFLKDS